MWLFLLAIAPGILLLLYIRRKDHTNPEPWKYIWITFFLSALLVIPVGLTESILEKITGWQESGPMVSVLLYSLIVVSLSEEFCKYLAIRIYVYKKPDFDETIDGLVYGAAAGAGFAVLENIFYVFQNGVTVAIMRAILSVPLHVFTGTLIGYGLIRQKHDNLRVLSVTLFFFSVVIHGLYDFALFTQSRDNPGVAIGISGGLVLLLAVVTRYFWRRYQTRPLEKEYRPSGFKKFVLILMGVFLILFSLVLTLGAWVNFKEGKKDDIYSYIFLIIFPALLGIFVIFRAKRYSLPV